MRHTIIRVKQRFKYEFFVMWALLKTIVLMLVFC